MLRRNPHSRKSPGRSPWRSTVRIADGAGSVASFSALLLFFIVVNAAVNSTAFGITVEAASPGTGFFSPSQPSSGNKPTSMVDARASYMWGMNEIWYYDGDNHLIGPGKQELTLNNPAFGLIGKTFATDDILIRGAAWISIPTATQNDFHIPSPTPFDSIPVREMRGWDTESRYISGDLATTLLFNLGGMPYHAGLTAGYRYNDFRYRSERSAPGEIGTFDNHLQVHIPYFGIYYAHAPFVGGLVRLDAHVSPVTLSLMDAERVLDGDSLRIDAHGIFGVWTEAVFETALEVGESAIVGLFARYNYTELSGGATFDGINVDGVSASTGFSMTSRTHLIFTGLSFAYRF